jgi:hypothetical protein
VLCSIFVHLLKNFDDINAHWAFGNASSASGALEVIEKLDKILEFMKNSLPQAGSPVRPGIMSRRMHCEIRELTGIPIPHPLSLKRRGGDDFIVDIETMACWTEIGAYPAAKATEGFFIPKGRFEHTFKSSRNFLDIFYMSFDFFI